MSAPLNARGERIAIAMYADFFTTAERLGKLSHEVMPSKGIDRPHRQFAKTVPLTRMADCVLCSLNVNLCRCDPDDYATALFVKIKNLHTEKEA